ncbi:MAG: hypothetical protein N2517_08710 [Ignavibacteria bacterium]|nr:hypothetical protein [Ignavibacteria bacterium]
MLNEILQAQARCLCYYLGRQDARHTTWRSKDASPTLGYPASKAKSQRLSRKY